MAAMREGAETIPAIVKIVYEAYPQSLHAAAGQSVCSHLLKLEHEDRVARGGAPDPLTDDWRLT